MNNHHSYTDPTRKDWILGLSVIGIFLALISVTAFWLLPDYWYIWLLIVIVGTGLIVNWHTKNYAFRCRSCGNEFEISFLTNLIAPHGIDKEGAWQYLRCPHCKKRTKANVIKIDKAE